MIILDFGLKKTRYNKCKKSLFLSNIKKTAVEKIYTIFVQK